MKYCSLAVMETREGMSVSVPHSWEVAMLQQSYIESLYMTTHDDRYMMEPDREVPTTGVEGLGKQRQSNGITLTGLW